MQIQPSDSLYVLHLYCLSTIVQLHNILLILLMLFQFDSLRLCLAKEERKHHQPGGHGSEDAEGEEEGLHSTNLGQTSQALSPEKEAAEAEAMDATNVGQPHDLGDGPHVPAGSTQVTFQSSLDWKHAAAVGTPSPCMIGISRCRNVVCMCLQGCFRDMFV